MTIFRLYCEFSSEYMRFKVSPHQKDLGTQKCILARREYGELGDFAIGFPGCISVKSGPPARIVGSLDRVQLIPIAFENKRNELLKLSIEYFAICPEIASPILPTLSDCTTEVYQGKVFYGHGSDYAEGRKPIRFTFPADWPLSNGFIKYGGRYLCSGNVAQKLMAGGFTNMTLHPVGFWEPHEA